MPDRFGNPTSLEIFQLLTQEKNAALNAGQSSQSQRQTRARLFGQALFGGVDPRLKEARAREDALAAGNLTRQDGEDSISFEKRRMAAMFDAMKEVDPGTAAEINAQLIALENTELERLALKQDTELTAMEIEDRKQQRDLAQRRFVYNPDTGDFTSYNIGDAYDAAYIKSLPELRQKGLLPADAIDLDFAGLVEMLGHEEAMARIADGGGSGLFTNARIDDVRGAIRAGTDVLSNVADLYTVFNEEESDELTDIAKITSLASAISSDAVDLAVREARYSGQYTATTGRLAGRVFENEEAYVDALLNEFASGSTRMMQMDAGRRAATKALMLRLSYMVAKSMDPGGRLSDKDVEIAWDMLGGDGRNEAVAARAIQTVLRPIENLVEENRLVRETLLASGNKKDGGHAILLGHSIDAYDEWNSKMQEQRDLLFHRLNPELTEVPQQGVPGRGVYVNPVTGEETRVDGFD